METSEYYTRYTILGLISVVMWSMKASDLSQVISMLVFICCILFLVILIAYDLSMKRLTYYSEKLIYHAITNETPAEVTESATDPIERYIVQEKFIGKSGQQKLADADVCIIGMGSIGTAVAELLARAGVGKINMIDTGRLVLPDLQDHATYSEADIGQYKATAAQDRLTDINSSIFIRGHRVRIGSQNEVLIDSDLVLDCTNKLVFKNQLNRMCRLKKIPWIFCLTTLKRGYVKIMDHDSWKQVHEAIPIQPHKTILNPTAHMGAGIMVTQALKILFKKNHTKKMIKFDAWDYQIKKIKIHN